MCIVERGEDSENVRTVQEGVLALVASLPFLEL